MMENICKISVFPYKLIHLYGNTSRLLKYMGISCAEYLYHFEIYIWFKQYVMLDDNR